MNRVVREAKKRKEMRPRQISPRGIVRSGRGGEIQGEKRETTSSAQREDAEGMDSIGGDSELTYLIFYGLVGFSKGRENLLRMKEEKSRGGRGQLKQWDGRGAERSEINPGFLLRLERG